MFGPIPSTSRPSAADRPVTVGSVGRATSAITENEWAGTNVRANVPSAAVTTSASTAGASLACVIVVRCTIVPAGGAAPLSSATVPWSSTALAKKAVYSGTPVGDVVACSMPTVGSSSIETVAACAAGAAIRAALAAAMVRNLRTDAAYGNRKLCSGFHEVRSHLPSPVHCDAMQPAGTRRSGVAVAVALLAGLLAPAAQAAGPPHVFGTAPAAPRLAVPFAAPGGYLFTVAPGAARTMRAAGASPLMPDAGIWRVARATGPSLATALRRTGELVSVDVNPRRQVRAADPLRAAQYAFGAISLPAAAPAPRRRILVVDTGLDVTVPDIAHRAVGTTVVANTQHVSGVDGDVEWH